jgi:phospholipase/carboxylesterase
MSDATERMLTLAGLSAIAIGDDDAPLAVIVLHGRQMQGSDLAPFGKSLVGSLPRATCFVFPDGPLAADPRGRTWWPVDSEARIRRLQAGPMDLSEMDPPGRAEARALLGNLIAAIARPGRQIVLVGFSQGGMLAMDYVLHLENPHERPAALALLSSTRIAITDWAPLATRLAGLPVLVAHGHSDAELSFASGEALRDFAIAGGANLTWLPFDGGHELPLVVWRALRKLLASF